MTPPLLCLLPAVGYAIMANVTHAWHSVFIRPVSVYRSFVHRMAAFFKFRAAFITAMGKRECESPWTVGWASGSKTSFPSRIDKQRWTREYIQIQIQNPAGRRGFRYMAV